MVAPARPLVAAASGGAPLVAATSGGAPWSGWRAATHRLHAPGPWLATALPIGYDRRRMDLARENRRLLAQVDFFSGDEHVRREAEPWRAASPAARLAAMAALCRQAARFQSRLTTEQRERADAPVPLPEDAVRLLADMRRG